MQPRQDPRARHETLDPTEARQASPRKMNFRVLIGSMVLAIVVGAVLLGGFWYKTPARVDASSGGNPSQNTEQAAPPSSATPQPGAGGAPEASPAPTTPSPAPEPSTP